VNAGLATMNGAGVDTFTVSALPAPIQLPLAVRMVGLPDEAQHTLDIAVLSPTMEPTSEPLNVTFTAEKNPLLPEGWESGTLLPVVIAFEATEQGPYMINVSVDGNSESVPIRVILAAQ
jgi:hypothetical protein